MATSKIRLMPSPTVTISNETVTLASYNIPTGKVISAEVSVVFYDTVATLGGIFKRIVAAKNTAGIALLVGGTGTNVVAPIKDSGYSLSILESVSGSFLNIITNGKLNVPINWYIIVDITTFN